MQQRFFNRQLRAGLVEHAEQWRWVQKTEPSPRLLSSWPIARLPHWTAKVNTALSEKELDAVRRCVHRGQPYGDEAWTQSIAQRLNLESTLRPRGRPKKSL